MSSTHITIFRCTSETGFQTHSQVGQAEGFQLGGELSLVLHVASKFGYISISTYFVSASEVEGGIANRETKQRELEEFNDASGNTHILFGFLAL